jgi:phosphate transport system protein
MNSYRKGIPMAILAEDFLQGPEAEHGYLVGLTLRACQIAKTAAGNAAEFVGTNLPELYEAVEDCEKKLDRLDRELDQRICAALEKTTALQRREMLACRKCMTDLERIGDLVVSFISGIRALRTRLGNEDVYELMRMTLLLEKMLNDVYDAFCTRDLNRALTVLRTDAEIDRLRKLFFIRHIEGPGSEPQVESVHVLLMAQALERAGDHAKNLAEEVWHSLSGYTLRHVIQKEHGSCEHFSLDWVRQHQLDNN